MAVKGCRRARSAVARIASSEEAGAIRAWQVVEGAIPGPLFRWWGVVWQLTDCLRLASEDAVTELSHIDEFVNG